jgi:Zn-dependent protease with chaperone function
MSKFFVIICIIALLCAGMAWANDSPNQSTTPGQNNQAVNATDTNKSALQGAATETAPEESIYPVSPERRVLLNKYSKFRLEWTVFYDIFQWIVLIAIAFTGFSRSLLTLAERWARRKSVQFLLYLLLLVIVTTLVSFPLDIYRDYVVEHDYNLSNQSFGSWLGDWAKSIPLGYIGMVIMAGFFYRLLHKFPRRWWLVFSIGAIPFVILVIVIVPVVISPMFNDFKPLEDQQLKTQILDLAGKAGIEGAKVFQVDASRQSKKLNAYVTGLFGTKRIVLYDTIIKAMSTGQLLFVMGHEMGHYVMHHVWMIVGLTVIILLVITWLIARYLPPLINKYQRRLKFFDMGSYASLPLVMLAMSLIMFFLQPITNGTSRYFEHKADIYGLEMTGYDGLAAAVAFDKLSAYNLSDPDPGPFIEFWFYDHPALQKRIDFVKGYRGEK